MIQGISASRSPSCRRSIVGPARDLFERQVEPVVEDDHQALGLTESRDRVSDRPGAQVLFGRLPHLPGVEGRLLAGERFSPPSVPEMVDRTVDRDPFQPGRERPCLIEAIERAERLHDRLLRRVVGERAIGGHGIGGAPCVRPVAVGERFSSLDRALPGKNDQLVIGRSPHGLQGTTQRTPVFIHRRTPPFETGGMWTDCLTIGTVTVPGTVKTPAV
ncbi:hypothetical protein BH18ACT13_BH18ACT13_09440 [soil metagenome]